MYEILIYITNRQDRQCFACNFPIFPKMLIVQLSVCVAVVLDRAQPCLRIVYSVLKMSDFRWNSWWSRLYLNLELELDQYLYFIDKYFVND